MGVGVYREALWACRSIQLYERQVTRTARVELYLKEGRALYSICDGTL